MARLLSLTFLFFEDCGGSDADSSLSYSVWCHYWHQARWRQVRFYFSYRSWDIWLNFKYLFTDFLRIYPCTYYWLSKSWWYNICFLGIPCMLWMHMLIMYAFVRMTPTTQNKIPLHFIFRVYPCTWYCLSKSWWDNLCFLGVPCMLWMHM